MAYLFPNLDVLGAGYDVFNLYADPQSKTYQIIDLGNEKLTINLGEMEYSYPKHVLVTNISKGEFSTIFGSTITEFQENFAAKASLSGSHGYFSGSIKSAYAFESAYSSYSSFCTIRDNIIVFKLSLPTPEEIIKRDLLLPQFKKDLHTLTPTKLFDKYGTHWVRSFLNGGRATYNATTTKFSGRSQREIGLDVETSYKSITSSAHAASSTNALSKKDFEEYYQTSSVITIGGDPSLSDKVKDGKWGVWAKTVLSNPVLIDFDRDSLVGLWELCEDQDKRNALFHAYEQYAASHKPFSSNEIVFYAGYCDSYEEIWKDRGSGAKKDVTLFHPVPALGYYPLGDVAVPKHSSDPSFRTLTLKPISDTLHHALKQPIGYEKIYDDKSTGAYKNCSIWKPIPPKGYVAIGYVAQSGYDRPSPNAIMCVREELVQNACVGDEIWNDKKSGGRMDCSIWKIEVPQGETSSVVVPEGLFIPVNNYQKPANNLTFALLRKHIKF